LTAHEKLRKFIKSSVMDSFSRALGVGLFLVALATLAHGFKHGYVNQTTEAKQTWNYVNVRPNAFMFWWLYYADDYANKPLIIWLQGGPGASSTGYGNIGEMGPLDMNLKPRDTTWLTEGSLLFIDQPVGSGYSYVTSDDAYTTDVKGISADLLVMIKDFMKGQPEFQKIPLYIFSESYGGKMAAAFSKVLYTSIQAGDVKCNFQGLAMGDSWISPLDYVLTWGPYLYATSLVDGTGLAKINKTATACEAAYDAGKFVESTNLWSETETVINDITGGVNFYNVLDWNPPFSQVSLADKSPLDKLYTRHSGVYNTPNLNTLMNGVIRKKLGIIPKNVTWGAQQGQVFQKQSGDFMKPVINTVDDLIQNTKLKVVVYSGQLDLICDTMGTEAWVQKLNWPGLQNYNTAPRKPYHAEKVTNGPAGYIKSYENFSFYWILNAGHMVPYDAGYASRTMVHKIVSDNF